ncbi:beta-1,4-glucuronyltransferase 1-like isoform X3 [Xenia sp. Carnegie-2017]|uniref:beta-1,4-glucuronyltransferase 1-like isoform X3 n=1 Tax=Xenia sp. Carnegie-2017 TaxID=2897299 RepID=UPI001F04DBA8|nr:beta-1,4-glucuronyltransferase 1-like isoform X3 [Xenia sp. Carnegie-2017]
MSKMSFILYLLIIAMILVFLNIFLMIYMDQNDKKLQPNEHFEYQLDNEWTNSLYKMNLGKLKKIHELPKDKSGEYYINKYFIQSQHESLPHDVVLVTHCTEDHLYRLISLAKLWQGSISVGVFVPNNALRQTLDMLNLLYQCYFHIRQQVSIHLIHPVAMIMNNAADTLIDAMDKWKRKNINCVKALEFFLKRSQDDAKNYAKKINYPSNVLRNVAKHGHSSIYSLVMDIDLVPNQNLRSKFLKFATQNNLFNGGNSFYNEKSVFVLPVFEMNSESYEEVPKEKSQLLNMLDKSIRPFYYEVCQKCQRRTDYTRWKSLDNSENYFDVGYEVSWKDPWEPFFISPTSAPDYDERFKQERV